jgi:hypothetical protein
VLELGQLGKDLAAPLDAGDNRRSNLDESSDGDQAEKHRKSDSQHHTDPFLRSGALSRGWNIVETA